MLLSFIFCLFGNNNNTIVASLQSNHIMVESNQKVTAMQINNWIRDGKKIIIREDLTKIELKNEAMDSSIGRNNEREVNLTKVGTMIYEDNGKHRYVNINVADTSEKFITSTFERVLESDFSTLDSKEPKIISDSSVSTTRSLSSWNIADSTTSFDAHRGADVRSSLIVYEDPSAPSSGGKYYHFAEYRIDADKRAVEGTVHFIKEIEVKLKNYSGTILKIVPESDISHSSSITISYPWGASLPIDFGRKIIATKTGGGISSNFVQYLVKSTDYYTPELDFLEGAMTSSSDNTYLCRIILHEICC